MDDSTKAYYEKKAKQLRASLKSWESEWTSSHDGNKPSRQDIKDNPSIAEKYRQYNKTRDILAGKIPPPSNEQSNNPKRRRPDPPPSETPSKKSKYLETPTKNRNQLDNDYMSTPAISRKLFSPAPVTSIGPTPQRDGRVLGLFDLLVEKELGTPSKNSETPATPGRRRNVNATPSKSRGSADAERLSRTPMSSSKRQMLNTFMTPLKNYDNTSGGKTPTPGSVSKLQFDTPAFLRRHTLPALHETSTFDAPAPLRLPRKPLGRGLSEIVASLRKVEDDKLDDEDDMAALREAEETEIGTPGSRTTRPATAPGPPKDDILAKDVQVAKIPLGGFDDEALYDSPEEKQLGRDGQPLKVYKKKGQKRTTRLVHMRPTITKRPKSPSNLPDVVPDTQLDDQRSGENRAGPENMSESDFEGSNVTKSQKPPQKEGTVKKTARKVNELAHANFKRLKLRSKGSKGKPGFNSRFRRR